MADQSDSSMTLIRPESKLLLILPISRALPPDFG